MVLVKICGITNLDDALAAVDAGADALGFNFCARSPRYVSAETAQSIINRLPAELLTVGVFVNEDLEAVRRIATTAGIKALQLHGDESPEYCEKLNGYYLIKVFAAAPEFTPERVFDYPVQAIMLDALDRGGIGGGTGRRSDWSVAAKAAELFPNLFLAGGLSAENVVEAISVVNPYAVDACSLLESAPGQKDVEKVRAFVAAVKKATV
ncbi:MAG TPA: phosphoribosylanthranilate isomerase [Pyrinomonadaceae bacterium]|jgi:phosphoribosylanthranilate isomerase|nr:phosphoribosylanthranilate isomerase [Pyrinomonadaceae bacterium]